MGKLEIGNWSKSTERMAHLFGEGGEKHDLYVFYLTMALRQLKDIIVKKYIWTIVDQNVRLKSN